MAKYCGRTWRFWRGRFEAQSVASITHGQKGRPEVVSPYGQEPYRLERGARQQFADPLGAYFGAEPVFGAGRHGQRQQARWEQNRSSIEQGTGPLAQFARQAGAYLPQVFGQAQGVGERIASMAPGLFDQIRNQVQGALGQLPGLQQTAQGQTTQAQHFLDQASSPIAQQALYQNALRSGLEGARSGQGARGLLDAGSAQSMEESYGRDLAAQFAQQQFGNQQAALGGVQNAMGAQAGLLPMGAQLAGMQASALPGLQQALQAGYQLPMEALQSVYQQLAAFQDPRLALAQLTAPQVGQRSEGGGGFGILGTYGSGRVVYWKGYSR